LGRRLFKETGEARTRFFWDGDALLGENTVSVKENSARASREYVYYPWTFEPLAMLAKDTNGRQVFYYQNDPNGCPIRLVDSSGQVKWAASYSAWGGVAKFHLNAVDNPIRLPGQYSDGETGLSYNRHRYFDSQVGAFVSIDPLGLRGGIHLYRYAYNISGWIDPLGLTCNAVDLARKAASKIPDEFKKILRCKEFADALQERLQKQGIQGTRLELQAAPKMVVYSDKYQNIAPNGYHAAIRVGDTVFDNLRPEGISHADFIKDLGGEFFTRPPRMAITETPF
jgi:RHS repeat-associated protein